MTVNIDCETIRRKGRLILNEDFETVLVNPLGKNTLKPQIGSKIRRNVKLARVKK